MVNILHNNNFGKQIRVGKVTHTVASYIDSNPYPQHYSVTKCSNSIPSLYIRYYDISVSQFLFIGPKFNIVALLIPR